MKKMSLSKEWKFSSPEISLNSVDLPHDYSIKLPRNPDVDGGFNSGYFCGSYGKYTKYMHFDNWEHAILDVDGAYMCSRVYLNENMLCMHPHGYTPFLVDLTDKMRKNRINKLQITTQNIHRSTRWYSGAGVYRDVFLWVGGALRIEPRDIFISTKSANNKNALVSISVTITSDYDTNASLEIEVKHEKTVALEKCDLTLHKGKNLKEFTLEIKKPALWDAENPNLYTLFAKITENDTIADTATETFGIRMVYANSKEGLVINGKSVKLKGGCIHHDHGGIGAISLPAAEHRKISLLKKAGFNAIRTAHNPPSLALLEVCDKLGMYVMDEAFDTWNETKTQQDYSLWFADHWARDLKDMVLRDRNHPSVISYSIGNEIAERGGINDGYTWSKNLSSEIRKYDNTKFVTSGVQKCAIYLDDDAPEEYKKDALEGYADTGDGTIESSFDKRTEKYMEPLDIVGYNYLFRRYEHDGKLYPNRVIWGSETLALEIWKSWHEVMRLPHVIGDFTWTAYDNLGEPGAGRSIWEKDGYIKELAVFDYPWRTSFQGDYDLAGYRRPQSYLRESLWKEDCEPRIFTTHPKHYNEGFSGTGWHFYDVCDSWTYDDKYIGKPVKAEVYTDAEEIRFVLNGKDMGIVKSIEGIAALDIPYEKGELTAISYKKGKEIKRFSLHTVEKASQIIATAEKSTIYADNRDLCYIDIMVADKNGDRIPDADFEVSCEVTGGELMSVFSGQPANEDEYYSGKCHLFFGRAVAVVRSKETGNIEIKVKSKSLKEAVVKITALSKH